MIEYENGIPTLSQDDVNKTVKFFKEMLGREPSALFFGKLMSLVDKEARRNKVFLEKKASEK